jgi:hypothetical protein
MATLVKTKKGHWKAIIRKVGWPASSKTFRTKRDAEDWARNTEDEMVRGVGAEVELLSLGEAVAVEIVLRVDSAPIREVQWSK